MTNTLQHKKTLEIKELIRTLLENNKELETTENIEETFNRLYIGSTKWKTVYIVFYIYADTIFITNQCNTSSITLDLKLKDLKSLKIDNLFNITLNNIRVFF